MAGEEAVAVELIEQFRAGAGEEHLHGVFFAAQDRAEFRAVARAKQRLRADAPGCSSKIRAQRSPARIRGGGERGRRVSIDRSFPVEQAAFRQAGQQGAAKTGCIGDATRRNRR